MTTHYTLLRENLPTAAIGEYPEMHEVLNWNCVSQPDTTWSLQEVPEAAVANWADQFLCPTDRGNQDLSPPFEYPPVGPLVQALFAFAKDSGYAMMYTKDIWRNVKTLRDSANGVFLFCCRPSQTHLIRLQFDWDYRHDLQEVIHAHNFAEYITEAIKREGFNDCALIQVAPDVASLTGIIERLSAREVLLALDIFRLTGIPQKPKIERSFANLIFEPATLHGDLLRLAEEAGAADGLTHVLNRLANYAESRYHYRCLIHWWNGMDFYAIPQTRNYGDSEWRNIIVMGAKYDPEEKSWRTSS